MKVIYQPVKPFRLNQKFGENNACISLDGANRVINCNGHKPPAGYKSLYGPLGHGGIDLRTSHGQEVYHACSGTVYKIDTSAKSGLDVRVECNEGGLIFRLIYEHLLGYQPKVGDKIKVGQLVGWADNTGYSSGNHLHFQMELWKEGAWVKVNPMDYMEDYYALDASALLNKLQYLKELLAKLLDNTAYKLRK